MTEAFVRAETLTKPLKSCLYAHFVKRYSEKMALDHLQKRFQKNFQTVIVQECTWRLFRFTRATDAGGFHF